MVCRRPESGQLRAAQDISRKDSLRHVTSEMTSRRWVGVPWGREEEKGVYARQKQHTQV